MAEFGLSGGAGIRSSGLLGCKHRNPDSHHDDDFHHDDDSHHDAAAHRTRCDPSVDR